MKEKNKKAKMQFIKTDNFEAAEQLRKSGYTELTEQSSTCYYFLNDGKLMFDEKTNEDINKKIFYTNIMCI
jgi:hypothetical protein